MTLRSTQKCDARCAHRRCRRQDGICDKETRQKKKKGPRKGIYLKTKKDGDDDFIQWCPALEMHVLNVHAAHNEKNLSTKCFVEKIAKMIRIAIANGVRRFYVIHGSSSGLGCWLYYLKRHFGEDCKRFLCSAISVVNFENPRHEKRVKFFLSLI